METNNQNSENGNRPVENPERRKEDPGYTPQTEQEQQSQNDGDSFSEQIDVTPPNHKEFPSEHSIETDFSSRPQGRTTGRMVGHEPGTESL